MQAEHRDETFRFGGSCMYVNCILSFLLYMLLDYLDAKYHIVSSRSKSFVSLSEGILLLVGFIGIHALIISDWCERYFLSLKKDCVIYPKREWGAMVVHKTVPLNEIVELRIEQGCVQRCFNTGDIVLHVGLVERKKIRVGNLCDPKMIVESIRKRQPIISINE